MIRGRSAPILATVATWRSHAPWRTSRSTLRVQYSSPSIRTIASTATILRQARQHSRRCQHRPMGLAFDASGVLMVGSTACAFGRTPGDENALCHDRWRLSDSPRKWHPGRQARTDGGRRIRLAPAARSLTEMIRIAILDDYQNVALEMADWSPLAGRARSPFSMTICPISTKSSSASCRSTWSASCARHTAATVSHRAVAATEADRIDRSSQRGHRCGGRGRARYRGSAYGIRCTPHHRDDLGSHPCERTSGRAGERTFAPGGWQFTVGESLHGKTLGVSASATLARRLRIGLAFGMEVIAWSQNLRPTRHTWGAARL